MSFTDRAERAGFTAFDGQEGSSVVASESDLAVIDEVVNDEIGKLGALPAILARLQELLGCVSPPVQEVVARRLALPPVTLQEVVSFAPDLSHRPQPGGVARLCGGAACLAPHGLGVFHAARGSGAAFGVGEVYSVPCLGACWSAPVGETGSERRGLLTPDSVRELVAETRHRADRRHRPPLRGAPATGWRREELEQVRARLGERLRSRARTMRGGAVREVLVCNGTACSRDAADRVAEAVSRSLAERGMDRTVRVVRVGCRGEEVGEVTVTACPPGWRVRGMDEGRAAALVAVLKRDPTALPADAVWPTKQSGAAEGVLRRCGCVDPCSLEEYIGTGGFSALERVLEREGEGREWALHTLKSAGLRARDKADTVLANQLEADRQAGVAVVLCPCVATDAHLAADVLLLGGDPFAVIEGVLLAGLLVGANLGIVMPPAGTMHIAEQMELAVALARRRGLLGTAIFGTALSFDVRVIPAPRQLVALDEAALRRLVLAGGPLKPASRSQAADLPRAFIIDPESAARLCGVLELAGSSNEDAAAHCAAQRLLTVAGAVGAPAVMEVPATATLAEVVAVTRQHDKNVAAHPKGVLSGGLTGVFEAGSEIAAGFASRGALLVLDEATCVVRFVTGILDTLVREACGACAPGRLGVRVLRDRWAQLAAGAATDAVMATIRETAAHVGATARCALGRGAAGVVASALAAFAEEVAAHVAGVCPARGCGRPRGDV